MREKSSYEKLEARLTRESRAALKAIKARQAEARERREQQVARRRYKAAESSRLTSGWVTGTGSSDQEIRSSLTNLRARGRAVTRDSSYAKRARRIVQNNVVGPGIGIQGQVKTTRGDFATRVNAGIEEAFRTWCAADSCHTGGELHFFDLERQLMGQVFEAGEVFVRLHFDRFGRSRVPLALEVVESERVPHSVRPPMSPPTFRVRMGVEVDKYHRPLAYWMRENHPSDLQFDGAPRQSERAERVPASQVMHLRLIDRWPQTRGVPWLHTALTRLNDMDGYSEAEIVAARGAANYLAAVEASDLDVDSPDLDEQEDGTLEMEVSPGIILRGRPGEQWKFFAPNRPNSQLDPFMRYMLREVASGADVSYESLSRDYSRSNYSSSRLALLDDRDSWQILQRWWIRSFREQLHRVWLSQAVMARAVPEVALDQYAAAPEKFEAVKFKPRGWTWVDPQKEIKAAKEGVKAGFTTVGKVIAATGGGDDIEDVLTERKQELELMEQLGLKFDTDPEAEPEEEGDPPPREEGEELEERVVDLDHRVIELEDRGGQFQLIAGGREE